MNDLDKWAAEQCGVEVYCTHKAGKYIELFWEDENIEWTIKDPRCREIYRKDWLSKNRNGSVEFYPSGYVAYRKSASEKAAHEVGEEACITAIWESEK